MRFTQLLTNLILEQSRFQVLYDKMVKPAKGSDAEGKKVKGIYTYKNGDVYVGEFNDNKRQGMATYIYKQPSLSPALYFEGEFQGYFGLLFYLHKTQN